MIGKGFYSKVFLVHRVQTGEPFAMKVIKKSTLRKESHKKRAITEKNIMQKCESPFIVKLHYTFQTDEKLYYILDFVNGGELHSKLLKKVRLKESLAKFYAAEILLGLKCLHENGVLYRDLKPRNVLVDKDGHIKLIDFGLSKIQSEPENHRMICGTPHYVAPEMLKGDEHTEMVDFWSFGVVVYEMLHGYYPFVDESIRKA